MPRFTPQTIVLAGIAPSFAAVTSSSDTIGDNDGAAYLHVKNGGGTAVTVTAVASGACSHSVVHNAAVSVPAASERMIGPFARERFGSEIPLTFSATASVTAAVFRVGG